jgi:16S rRNA A1518/A1519 N6-dimethyltransferase RsmA/KsgA/DIM1 with predicted DNA glycosylase/AP lyase activity
MGEVDVARCEVTAILDAVPVDCRRLLEIGSGGGRITADLVAHGLVVDAVDIDRTALARAAKTLGRSKRVRFHRSVPASPKRWSAIVFSHSL